MKILVDLKDIDGRLIAPANSKVSAHLIKEVMKRGAKCRKKQVGLNKRSFITDLQRVLQEPIYKTVFASDALKKQITSTVSKIRLDDALYREVQSLKRRSSHTYRHLLLLGALAARMAMDLKAYGMKAKDAFVYGLLHDIGKVRIPMKVLNKKDRLTSQEYRMIRSYPQNSILLLRYYLGKKGTEACRVAYEHHETLDGTGYPKGIKTLSKYTRMIAVLDIFDALVSERPYRKRAFTVRGALDKLIHGMDVGKFPKLPTRLLISYFRTQKTNYRSMVISRRPREADPKGNSYGKTRG